MAAAPGSSARPAPAADSDFSRTGPLREEVWFTTLGLGADRSRPFGGADTVPMDLPRDPPSPATPAPGRPEPAPGRAAAGGAPPSPAATHSPVRDEPPASFQRMLRAFLLARALLGFMLLAGQALAMVYLGAPTGWPSLLVCGAHVGASLAMLLWPGPPEGPMTRTGHLRGRWTLATVGADLLAFTLLLVLGGPGVNATALFMLPVLMAATLQPRLHAFGVAGLVLLLLVAEVLWRTAGAGEPLAAAALMQAGVAGGGVLTVAMLASELSHRLARQEATARSTLEIARQQARLNRLMIEEMQDGVMVADLAGRVQAANPAALLLIGAPAARRFMPFDLRDLPAWQPLHEALERGCASGTWPEGGEEVTLHLPQQALAAAAARPVSAHPADAGTETRTLRVRMRFTRRRDTRSGQALCVLFLEDMRTLRARARQERLAAMGRMSAGIAHEIRNPLAAIAQANALLAEDLQGEPGLQRLTRMVDDNVERLRRIVDDVAEVSPGMPREAPVVDLGAEVVRLCAEWARTAGMPDGDAGPLFVDPGDEPLPVRFDPEHLRRVLVNLLDNGLRHGTGQPHAVWVRTTARQDEVELTVASDGEVIGPDVEPHLFEPFFSTRSRGTGLGLHICRELCERHGAAIDFRPRGPGARHRNVFCVTMPQVTPPGAPAPDPS